MVKILLRKEAKKPAGNTQHPSASLVQGLQATFQDNNFLMI